MREVAKLQSCKVVERTEQERDSLRFLCKGEDVRDGHTPGTVHNEEGMGPQPQLGRKGGLKQFVTVV